MHESGVAENMVKAVLKAAREHGADTVEAVHVRLGQIEHISPESLEEHFRHAAEGTGAEGARLICEEVPGRARCRACDAQFDTDLRPVLCPECDSREVELVSGLELEVVGIDVPE
ncbi:MAG: hydrogenase maturation nickel metallochaperone HypA [Armatimonadota bacterium]